MKAMASGWEVMAFLCDIIRFILHVFCKLIEFLSAELNA